MDELRACSIATEFFDSTTPAVLDFARDSVAGERDPVARAVRLFYAVRDGLDYEIYDADLSRQGMRASSVLARGSGLCLHKSILFIAAARALGLPSRIALCDVRNHLSTGRLRTLVGGDVFHYHGYVVLWLDGRWVKTTPVFNARLCKLAGIRPLDFDGRSDALLQPYDATGSRHLEVLREHGSFEEFPYERCIAALRRLHPLLFATPFRFRSGGLAGDLGSEALESRQPRIQAQATASAGEGDER